jgi:hypothetical protein
MVANLEDPRSIEVPACPPWTVHDLVSHLTGNCADVLKGNIAGLATDEWTGAQVDERRDRSTQEVLDEWAQVGPMFASMIDDFPGQYGRMVIGDVTVHEHDVRGAIDAPGERESRSVELATDFAISIVVDGGCRSYGVGPLEISTPSIAWIVGRGGPAVDDPEFWRNALQTDEIEEPQGAPVGRVSGSLYDIFRAVTGRRSANQVRQLEWSVAPEPFLPVFGFGPFALRSTDLID